ncbi:type IV CRISPR-associated protein Csf3 [Ottowia sp.]|uniref:type IV CRISPR-associated protein Csf3 n=1 Tax=Ottowia sp. TaxID=1898956 RepID=UPI0025EA39A9|nr:type IV CRISPR-associated protein Csf3 [Ottowia sp.]MBK6616300.1 hypothetical protein [Ottowia sp.]
MQPLRVTLRLGEPIARGTFPLLLDGLLAWAVVDNELSMATDVNDTRLVSSLATGLPLETAVVGGHEVWCASAWMPVGRVGPTCEIDPNSYSGISQQRILTRKSDLVDFSAAVASGLVRIRTIDKDKIGPNAYVLDTSRGLFKNYHLSYTLKSVDALEAWCIGDPHLIEEYLRDIEFVGPKRRLGHGMVTSIEVVPDERAVDLWRLRPLPERSDDIECVAVRMPARSPYWVPENAVHQEAPTAIFW